MKAKLVLLTILVSLFGIFVLLRFFILDKQNLYGKLKIISSPSSSIFIDNLNIGRTPFEDKYKVGEYFLKLIPEGIATETASWQSKIKIYKNALTYVNRELGASDLTSAGEIFTIIKMDKPSKNANFGEIYVETDPAGAIVYLDNDEKGVAPLILTDVLKGDHELSVFMPGFFRRNQKVNVESGYRINASFKLAMDQSSSLNASGIEKKQEATDSAAVEKKMVLIGDTPTGWLRVREDASVDASEAARIKPGEKFEWVETQDGWYKIKYDTEKLGWVSSEYSSIVTSR